MLWSLGGETSTGRSWWPNEVEVGLKKFWAQTSSAKVSAVISNVDASSQAMELRETQVAIILTPERCL